MNGADVWQRLADYGSEYGLKLLAAVALFLVGRWIAGSVERGVLSLSERTETRDPTLVPLLSKIARWVVIIVALVAALDLFGIETSSILALIGAAGLAVGLALKDVVSDVAAGVQLLVLRPFDVGEAVDIEGTAGTVAAVGLFQTRLVTFDGVPLVMPNRKVRSAIIRNFSRAKARRFDLRVGVPYREDVTRAVALVQAAVDAEPRIRRESLPVVTVETLGESAVNVLVRAWTAPGDLFSTQCDLVRTIKERFDEAGIAPAFPRRTLHIVDERSQVS